MLGPIFADAMPELAGWPEGTSPEAPEVVAAERAADSIACYTDAAVRATSPNGQRLFLALFRAFATVSDAFTVTETTEDFYTAALDRFELDTAAMLPVRAVAPWQIAAMPGGTVADETEWLAASFWTQYLIR